MISKLGIFTRVYAGVKVDASKIHRRKGRGERKGIWAGHLERVERKVPGKVVRFRQWSGAKKRGGKKESEGERPGSRFGKKSAEIYANKLARDDREIEFPRKEILLSPCLLGAFIYLSLARDARARTRSK